MITTIKLSEKEVISLSEWNRRAEERWARSIKSNPDRDPDTLLRLESEKPHPWNRWSATDERVDPVILDTHGIKPFPDNQGTLEFECTAEQLRGALEGSESSAPFHFVTQGDGWDYSRTFCNVSWKKVDDDWGLVDPDPSKVWVTNRDQIEDGKTYHITCIGGWGYVFIHEIAN